MREKAQFERLLRSGERRNLDGYTFFLQRREHGGARLGIVISRRHASRASDRNAIKRRIREAFRLQHENLGALDILVRPPYGIRASKRMGIQLSRLFARIAG